MSGGKGGSQTTEVKIPKWLENAAKQNIQRADVLSTIGYTPYYGPDVAGFTPQQMASMQGTNQAASAFGMPTSDPMAGMPSAGNYGGMAAYSSGGLYDQALADLQANRPGQFAALTAPFIDPVTGAAPQSPFGPLVGGGAAAAATDPLQQFMSRFGGSNNSGSSSGSDRMWSDGMTGDQIRQAQQSGTFGRTASGAGGTTSINTPLSYAPGGVNTRNPSSFVNTTAAGLTSGTQGAPTAANRPVARPTSSGSSGMGGGK
jgi:hypothetical protein